MQTDPNETSSSQTTAVKSRSGKARDGSVSEGHEGTMGGEAQKAGEGRAERVEATATHLSESVLHITLRTRLNTAGAEN